MNSAVTVTLRRRSSGVSGLTPSGDRGDVLVSAGTTANATGGTGSADGAPGIGNAWTTSGGPGGILVSAGTTATATGGTDGPNGARGIGNARTTSLGTGFGLYSTARHWASSCDFPSARVSTPAWFSSVSTSLSSTKARIDSRPSASRSAMAGK